MHIYMEERVGVSLLPAQSTPNNRNNISLSSTSLYDKGSVKNTSTWHRIGKTIVYEYV